MVCTTTYWYASAAHAMPSSHTTRVYYRPPLRCGPSSGWLSCVFGVAIIDLPTDARDSCWRNRSRRNSIAAWVTVRAHMYSTASLTPPGPRGIVDSSDVLLHQTPYASLCSYHPLLHSPHFRLGFRHLRITCYLRWPICKKHTVQQFPTS